MTKPALIVDAHALGDSGIGRYTRELVRELAQRDDFRMIYCAGDPAVISGWLTRFGGRTPLTVLPFRHARHSPLVPMQWAAIEREVAAPRVSWFPHWDGAWRASPCVTTIHDLINLHETGIAGAAKAVVARNWIAKMLRASRTIVTVSEYSARQIEAEFPEAMGKLLVVHNGVSPAFFEAGETARPNGAATSVASPYLLTVGNKRAHKRFETAIEAFARLASERPSLRLKMVGSRDAHVAVLRTLAQSLGVADRVDDIAPVGDAELASLYAGAEALLVTSREEGFGLIAVEAMAAGCPVIAVNRGPLPEVVGDAGVLVPYDDPGAMAQALRELDRAGWVAKGRERAARFTWKRAAESLATVLLRAASH